MSSETSDAIPEPIEDWDDDPTVEIPAQTMREIVYGVMGAEDTQPIPGHAMVGPARPTRDMRPLGRRGTLGMGRKGRK